MIPGQICTCEPSLEKWCKKEVRKDDNMICDSGYHSDGSKVYILILKTHSQVIVAMLLCWNSIPMSL